LKSVDRKVTEMKSLELKGKLGEICGIQMQKWRHL